MAKHRGAEKARPAGCGARKKTIVATACGKKRPLFLVRLDWGYSTPQQVRSPQSCENLGQAS